jgi:hypothetical protein
MTSDNYHLDVPYMAGLFDGEGSVSLNKSWRKEKTEKNRAKYGKLEWKCL